MVVSVYVREGMGYGMKITCGVAPWIEAGCISWIVASPPERKRGRRGGGGGSGDGSARAGAVGRQPVVCTGEVRYRGTRCLGWHDMSHDMTATLTEH